MRTCETCIHFMVRIRNDDEQERICLRDGARIKPMKDCTGHEPREEKQQGKK